MAESLGAARGQIRIVDDVPLAYGAHLAESVRTSTAEPFVLACSGGASGRACVDAAIAHGGIDWARVAVVFVDERCVAPDDPDANERSLREAFGSVIDDLAGFYPMRCADGADAYAARLRELGRIDLCQLGFGPDGHTASLFPGSTALAVDDGRLVVDNLDPTGTNEHARLTLTLAGIAMSQQVIITVVGVEKARALTAVRSGADLPAARVRAGEIVWLIERSAWEASHD